MRVIDRSSLESDQLFLNLDQPRLMETKSFIMNSPKICLAWIGCLLLSLTGCGDSHPARSPVSGTVTYNDEPLHIGSLVFVPVEGGPSAEGKIDEEGNYVLGTFEESDGAITGEYQVMITALTSPGGSGLPEDAVNGNAGPVSVIPEWYGNISSSGLKVTVEPDKENVINFPLDDTKPDQR